MSTRTLIRNHRSGDLLEAVLISAITSLLGVRFFLYLTHYPQVGGQSLHIAHMLYGGALMFVSIIILLSFLGNRIQRLAAIIGGIGFGFFIDELGKFITRDNNYFFQPTVVIIYVIFIALYLLFRWLSQARRLTQQEYLINALELMEEAVLGDMDKAERQEIIFYLRQADQSNPLVRHIKTYVDSVPVSKPTPGWLSRRQAQVQKWYSHVVNKPWFGTAFSAIFIIDAVFGLIPLGLVIASYAFNVGKPGAVSGITTICVFVASVAVAICVLRGALLIRSSRLHAYEWFRLALLVDIFFKQPFLFYSQQFRAISGLAIYLVGLATLNYIIHREHEKDS